MYMLTTRRHIFCLSRAIELASAQGDKLLTAADIGSNDVQFAQQSEAFGNAMHAASQEAMDLARSRVSVVTAALRSFTHSHTSTHEQPTIRDFAGSCIISCNYEQCCFCFCRGPFCFNMLTLALPTWSCLTPLQSCTSRLSHKAVQRAIPREQHK